MSKPAVQAAELARSANDPAGSEAEVILHQRLDERHHVSSRNSHPAERIETVRQELAATRRRNVELISEIAGLHEVLDRMCRSTSWRVTAPLRWVGTNLPPGMRRGLRLGARTGWWLVTLGWLRIKANRTTREPVSRVKSPEDWDAGIRPSDCRRRLDPSWVEPIRRLDFIRLRDLPTGAKLAVVVHIYYTDVWPELEQAIGNIPEDFDLFVTLIAGVSDGLVSSIQKRFKTARVLLIDNHGRDIFPFLVLIQTGVLFEYELVCKIHSKRSVHSEGGDAWRKNLVAGMLGSTGLVEQILDAFRADPDLGLVAAAGQIFEGRTYWRVNETRSSQLCRAIGLNESAFECTFAGGSMFWIRPFVLRTINALQLGYDDFEPEPITNDGYTAHAVERLFSLICHDAGMRVADQLHLVPSAPDSSVVKVHVIANDLPRFHPGLDANDRWAQARQARGCGVTAFCYYDDWFNGRRSHPIEAVVASGDTDFPFMLCWENDQPIRHGCSQEITQDYFAGWEHRFAADTAPSLRDRRYLRLNGQPILAIHRIAHVPDCAASIGRLRKAFSDEGIAALHLVGGWLQIGQDKALPENPSDLGLDAYFELPPYAIPRQCLRVLTGEPPVYDYGATVEAILDRIADEPAGFRYRGVMTGSGNDKSFAFHGATPANFRRWLRATLQIAQSEARGPETAVFINAWRQAADATGHEPDSDFGRGWLEAIASATAGRSAPG